MKIDRTYIQKWREQLEEPDHDALDYWAEKINPKVENMIDVKRAILLSLASHGDNYGDRGRIHVLLKGKPGTAKSMLMEWCSEKLGCKSAGNRSTSVGLTGDMRGDEITPGALPKANDHAICVDELDKIKKDERAGLLEAMARGTVTLVGGGMEQIFPARVRVIAGCNRMKKIIKEQEELPDRFDFFFNLKTPSKEKSTEIMGTRIQTWMRPKADYEGEELRMYLEWIHQFSPKIEKDVEEKAENLINLFIMQVDESKGIRYYEGIIRTAYTLAKLHRRNMTVEDVVRAILLKDPTFEKNFTMMVKSGAVNGWLKDPIVKLLGMEES